MTRQSSRPEQILRRRTSADEATWFLCKQVRPGLVRISEPHVHPMLQSNIWWIRGQERDVVIDAGLGVTSLREHLPELFERNPYLVITHAHLDHVGGAHEFDEVAISAQERASLEHPEPTSLRTVPLYEQLGIEVPSGEEPTMLRQLPSPGYSIDAYGINAKTPARTLTEGDVIEELDRPLRVLATPGHSPGSICVYDEENRWLFTGDTVYDGQLLDSLKGANRLDYQETMGRLARIDFEVAFTGHGPELPLQAFRRVIADYAGRS